MTNIYIQGIKKVDIIGKTEVTIGDISVVEGNSDFVEEIRNVKILNITERINKNYLISIIEVIKEIQKQYCDVLIQSVGEHDIIVAYSPNKKKENKLFTIVKIIFVCLTLFAGGGIAIMTFHTDAALPDVFVQLYKIFIGKENLDPYIIEIPYSIGLATGIIVFFNHFSSKRLTEDPTPIEVEMRMYERDVEDCIIETLIEERDQ